MIVLAFVARVELFYYAVVGEVGRRVSGEISVGGSQMGDMVGGWGKI